MGLENYKDLIAWQKAMVLVTEIYRVTRDFPGSELYGLTNQLRRAAVSIPSNIAEGQGRGGSREFERYLRIANGSQQEVETQLLIAANLGYLDGCILPELIAKIAELGRILSGLRRSITTNHEPPTTS
jgi:four helix bundle protein